MHRAVIYGHCLCPAHLVRTTVPGASQLSPARQGVGARVPGALGHVRAAARVRERGPDACARFPGARSRRLGGPGVRRLAAGGAGAAGRSKRPGRGGRPGGGARRRGAAGGGRAAPGVRCAWQSSVLSAELAAELFAFGRRALRCLRQNGGGRAAWCAGAESLLLGACVLLGQPTGVCCACDQHARCIVSCSTPAAVRA